MGNFRIDHRGVLPFDKEIFEASYDPTIKDSPGRLLQVIGDLATANFRSQDIAEDLNELSRAGVFGIDLRSILFNGRGSKELKPNFQHRVYVTPYDDQSLSTNHVSREGRVFNYHIIMKIYGDIVRIDNEDTYEVDTRILCFGPPNSLFGDSLGLTFRKRMPIKYEGKFKNFSLD